MKTTDRFRRLRPALLALVALLAACGDSDPPTISLYLAVHRGDINQLERHIRNGAELNQWDADGRMPLHVAAEAGRAPIVELLLNAGAEPNAQDRTGKTPMQIALLNGRAPVAELLKRRGAQLDADALLLQMVRNGMDYREVIGFLVRNGARINQPGPDGDTPLILAIRRKDRVMVKRLIEQGADVNLPAADGTLPRHLAHELQEPEIERMLHRQGANPGDAP